MVSTVFHFLDACRMFGIAQALHLASRWAIRREFLVVQRDLRDPLPVLPAGDAFRWTHLTETDIPRVQALNPSLYEAEIRRRVGEGQDCLLCWLGDTLVHYTWRAMRPAYLPYLGKTIWPLAGDVFVVASFTHPAFRRRGIHTWSINRTAREARESGLSRRLSMVPWWNTPSIRALRKNGCTVAGRIGYWNAGVRRYYFAAGEVHLNHAGVLVRPLPGQGIADPGRQSVSPSRAKVVDR
ncbi:MAG: GNAT family N-acetyltransferase [candidate division NC10 bacterium]|nr:GNAT family N-acetyltransferase [candidate division NC10 bacterium]